MLRFLFILFDIFLMLLTRVSVFTMCWSQRPWKVCHYLFSPMAATLLNSLFLSNFAFNPVPLLVLLFYSPASSISPSLSLLSFYLENGATSLKFDFILFFRSWGPSFSLPSLFWFGSLSLAWGRFKQIKIELSRTVPKELEQEICPVRGDVGNWDHNVIKQPKIRESKSTQHWTFLSAIL